MRSETCKWVSRRRWRGGDYLWLFCGTLGQSVEWKVGPWVPYSHALKFWFHVGHNSVRAGGPSSCVNENPKDGRPPLFLWIKIHSQAPALDTQNQNFKKIVKDENKVFVVLSELFSNFLSMLALVVVVTFFKGVVMGVLVALCFWLGKWKGKCNNNTNWLGKKTKRPNTFLIHKCGGTLCELNHWGATNSVPKRALHFQKIGKEAFLIKWVLECKSCFRHHSHQNNNTIEKSVNLPCFWVLLSPLFQWWYL